MRKRGATWDNLPLPAFTLDDVDDEIVEHFKKWAAKKGRVDTNVLDEPKDVLMEKLHLVNGSYLSNAAMLLFSKDPEKWQLGVYVKIGFLKLMLICCIKMRYTALFWNRLIRSWTLCI